MRRLKTKLLFSLVSEVNFFTKAEGYKYKGYKYLYFRLSEYEKGSVRDAVNRLEKEGAIDKIVRGNQVRLRLTGIGRERLLEQIDRYKGQKQVWDRIWRIVILTEVEGQSREIKRVLTGLGYQRVSRGVYVTPLRVSEATKEVFSRKNWSGKAQVIESRKLIVGDDQGLARRLWQLDQTAAGYLGFIKQAERVLKMGRKNVLLLQQSKGGFKQVYDEYFELLLSDPGLPKKLLAEDWPSDKADELFARLVILANSAGI